MKLHKHLKHKYFRHGVLFLVAGVFSLVAAGSLLVAARFARAAPITPPTGYEWKQVFNDEFNGTSLDTTKWNRCYFWYSQYYDGCGAPGGGELEWYTSSQVTVGGGNLRLTADRRNVQGWNGSSEQTFNYVSGMVTTHKYNYESYSNTPWAAKYGYFEARIKLPSGQGIWPAFWLLPEDENAPPEIDAMEFIGSEPSKIYMTYHYVSGGNQQTQTIYSNGDFSAGWHTYGVDWEPGKITWYIDGVARKTYTSSTVASKPMYILINMAVGGAWPGAPDGTTVFPAHMDIDYVRVYQLQTATTTGTGTGSASTPQPSGNSTPTPGGTTAQTDPSGQAATSSSNPASTNPKLTTESAQQMKPTNANSSSNSPATHVSETPKQPIYKSALIQWVAGLSAAGTVGLGAGLAYLKLHHIHIRNIGI